jgi:hypothetical protein
MRVTLGAREHPQHRRAQDIPHLGGRWGFHKSATKASNSLAVFRESMKNGSCPRAVITASWSHSTRTVPWKLSIDRRGQISLHNRRLLGG